jgi:hypothetical protein
MSPTGTTGEQGAKGQPAGLARRLRLLGAGLAAVAIAYLVTRHLQALPSTFLTAVLLAGGSVASGRTRSPWRWRTVMGACCGGLLGTAMVVAQKIHSGDPQAGLHLRLAMVASLMVAGASGGRSFSLDAAAPDRRRPKDTLRSASALTTGIFATLVTFTFLYSGLDQARMVSSRLSTSLTILVLSLSGPGWVAHQLSEGLRHRRELGAHPKRELDRSS